MKNFLLSALKWITIGCAAWIAWQWSSGQSSETLLTIGLVVVAFSVSYVEGSLKDRIEVLEYRVNDLSQKLNHY